MEARYGRNIDYMRISITDRCNLRCCYCMPEGLSFAPVEELLSLGEIEAICQAAAKAGIRKLKVTGGEPLVRPGCPSLIGKLKRIPGIEQVTMTTNGIALGQFLPELLEHGLDGVNISLDTLKPQVYRQITGEDKLEAVLENIRQAADAGIPVKINAVLQKGVNDGEWLDLALLAKRLPVDVRYIEMMPLGQGKGLEPISNKSLLRSFQKAFPGFREDRQVHGNGPAAYYRFPGARGSIGFISAIHGRFCKGCNRIRLTSRGKLKPCLCFGEEVDLMGVLRRNPELDECAGQKSMELQALFRRAVLQKPKEHRFGIEKDVTEGRQMVQIGG